MPQRVLVLTDIVDSTQLTAQLGNAESARRWGEHDRLARTLLAAHGGREIDRTDGFLLLFDEVAPAVGFALAYHEALGALEFRARIGIHEGEVVLIENSAEDVNRGAKPLEVEGLAKPLTARIASVAIGGQTLVSGAAHRALGAHDHREISHGHWRLKGVEDPVELVEIGGPEAPFLPPPDRPKAWQVVSEDGLWVPRNAVPHALPAERDAFVGRDQPLRALAAKLDAGSRLVTLLGPGGAGKTRLVTRFGWTWLGEYPGGVWFCDLSEARSITGICSAVGQALDVQLGGSDPVTRLGRAIAGRGPCLVVLDNFEQVVDAARHTVGPWLDRAPEARFLVTSRERLQLGGETVLRLAPMETDDGLRLFEARARQLHPDFAPSDADRTVLSEVVALLDGLPLAIELAAARSGVLSPTALRDRMDQRFKLLRAKGRGPRQATLRGALDWSWDLLEADEQAALAQLSVFEGGFTFEAAEAVLELAEDWPMDAVQSLVDKSLVRPLGGQPPRMVLLVSVQAYAAEKLDESGDRDATERRHGAWAAGLGVPERLARLHGPGAVSARRLLARELDNLVAALERSLGRNDGPAALGALAAVLPVFEYQGPFPVLRSLADRVRQLPGLDHRQRAEADQVYARACGLVGLADEAESVALAALARLGPEDHLLRGLLLRLVGRSRLEHRRFDEAEGPLREAAELFALTGDKVNEAQIRGQLGVLYDLSGREIEAIGQLEAALRILRSHGALALEGNVVANLGMLHADRERAAEATELLEQALRIHRQVGNRRSEGVVLSSLAHQREGLEAKIATGRQALAIHEQLGNAGPAATTRSYLGNNLSDLGELEAARAMLEASVAGHREVGNQYNETIVLVNLGRVLHQLGFADEARQRWHEAVEVGERAPNPARVEEARALLAGELPGRPIR